MPKKPTRRPTIAQLTDLGFKRHRDDETITDRWGFVIAVLVMGAIMYGIGVRN